MVEDAITVNPIVLLAYPILNVQLALLELIFKIAADAKLFQLIVYKLTQLHLDRQWEPAKDVLMVLY